MCQLSFVPQEISAHFELLKLLNLRSMMAKNIKNMKDNKSHGVDGKTD